MSKEIRFALLTVIAHVAVVALHGAAHTVLGVDNTRLQTLFIVVVILIAPPLAGVLLWKRERAGAGGWVLTTAMAGALLFGVYHHFVAFSPDHVSHVLRTNPASLWATVFQVTAFLLVLVETLGTVAGLMAVRSAAAVRG